MLILTLVLMSCNEEEGADNPASSARTIYLCGGEDGTYPFKTSYYEIATYWVNGEPTPLYIPTFEDNGWLSKAWGITVEDGNVYVTGMQHFPGKKDQAVYWKNGDPHTLSSGEYHARGFDIAVNNGTVYVAGEEFFDEYYSSKYWVNGSANVLVSNSIGDATATGIAVSNGDVYVAGSEYNDDPAGAVKKLPTVWKNGSGTELFSKEGKYHPGKMTVVGDDVYVAGYIDVKAEHQAIVWKNGSYEVLNGDIKHAYAYDVDVYNGDIYVAGKISMDGLSKATYWKNGVANVINTASESVAHGIYVKDGDVYMVGYEGVGTSSTTAKLWVNGSVEPNYTLPNAFYTDVFVE